MIKKSEHWNGERCHSKHKQNIKKKKKIGEKKKKRGLRYITLPK